MQENYSVVSAPSSVLATNTVLRNTYILLGLTLMFSALVAGVAMVTNATLPGGFAGILFLIVGMYGLMFLTMKLRDSMWGLAAIFAFTGFMGYTLGPLLNTYIANFTNGPQLIMMSLGGTGLTFFGLSAYALVTRKDFNYMHGFILVGCIAAIIAMVANIFLQIPALQLAISGAFVLISSAMILFETSRIINGGERNYIMATISLYVALYNLFISLLHILSALTGNRD